MGMGTGVVDAGWQNSFIALCKIFYNTIMNETFNIAFEDFAPLLNDMNKLKLCFYCRVISGENISWNEALTSNLTDERRLLFCRGK